MRPQIRRLEQAAPRRHRERTNALETRAQAEEPAEGAHPLEATTALAEV